MLDRITPVLLTRDEEANIARTLGQLAWAGEIIVVDSGSTDRTCAIVGSQPRTRLEHRELTTLADQWSFAASLASTEWILTLDADYFVPDAFRDEVRLLEPEAGVAGYEAEFDYAVGGRRLRAALYTPRAVLLRRGRFAFYQDGHTQRVRLDGATPRLRTRIVHDDRKPLSRFIARQRRYMRDEAQKLRDADPRTLNAAARIRKLRVIAPFAVLFYTLVVQRLILDGLAGMRYALERFLAEAILSWELFRGQRSGP